MEMSAQPEYVVVVAPARAKLGSPLVLPQSRPWPPMLLRPSELLVPPKLSAHSARVSKCTSPRRVVELLDPATVAAGPISFGSAELQDITRQFAFVLQDIDCALAQVKTEAKVVRSLQEQSLQFRGLLSFLQRGGNLPPELSDVERCRPVLDARYVGGLLLTRGCMAPGYPQRPRRAVYALRGIYMGRAALQRLAALGPGDDLDARRLAIACAEASGGWSAEPAAMQRLFMLLPPAALAARVAVITRGARLCLDRARMLLADQHSDQKQTTESEAAKGGRTDVVVLPSIVAEVSTHAADDREVLGGGVQDGDSDILGEDDAPNACWELLLEALESESVDTMMDNQTIFERLRLCLDSRGPVPEGTHKHALSTTLQELEAKAARLREQWRLGLVRSEDATSASAAVVQDLGRALDSAGADDEQLQAMISSQEHACGELLSAQHKTEDLWSRFERLDRLVDSLLQVRVRLQTL